MLRALACSQAGVVVRALRGDRCLPYHVWVAGAWLEGASRIEGITIETERVGCSRQKGALPPKKTVRFRTLRYSNARHFTKQNHLFLD